MENQNVNTPTQAGEEHFVPKGAIAFFVLLLIVFALIWFAIYFLMLNRA